MNDSATGRGVGKLILCGEHAVVYGFPALAFAVNRGMRVDLTRVQGPLRLAQPEVDERLLPALGTVLPAGLSVQISSDLPIGRGMGSSAALAVAAVRALNTLEGGPTLTPEQVFDRAMPAERAFHGNPSGLDVAVAARGGFLRYRRADPPEICPIPARPRWQVVVLDSDAPGDTAALVAAVGAQRPAINPLLQRIGDLVVEAESCLDDAEVLGELLCENHRILAQIGVSTRELDDLVSLAMDHGATGAKLAGAGGGGVVLAITLDATPLLQAAARLQIPAFRCCVEDVP